MFDKVKDIIVEELDADAGDITLETNLKDDLDADSIDAVQLIGALEDEFEIEIPDEAAQGLTTVGQIVSYLETATK